MSDQLREAWRVELSKVLLAKAVEVASANGGGGEATFGDFADAIIDRYQLDEDRHLVRFTSIGWTLQHPVAERMTGLLLDCTVHQDHAHLFEHVPSSGPGDYWLSGESLERVEHKEATA